MKSKIVINPTGGLANRMRVIAGGISLAHTLGIEYEVIWAVNSELGARFDELFEIPKCLKNRIFYPKTLKYSLLFEIPRKRNLYFSALFRSRFGAIVSDIHNINRVDVLSLAHNAIKAKKNVLFQGGTNIFEYSNELYRSLFFPVADIRNNIGIVLSNLGKESVGLHIRRTDNVESINHSPNELFEKEINERLSNSPKCKFYLASDSQEVKSYFGEIYGDKIIYDTNPVERSSLTGMKKAVEEMFVLAGTQCIIGSYYSSYSEAASMIGDVPLTQLYK